MQTSYYFAQPWVLFLLPVLVAFPVWYFLFYRGQRLRFRLSYDPLKLTEGGFSQQLLGRLRYLPYGLALLGLLLLVVALARPQRADTFTVIESEGIDIVLALDVSHSMEAVDMQPSRLEVAKQKATSFIHGRRNDRIGVVLFAQDAMSYAPLTLDYALLEELIGDIRPGILPKQGTALGDAIGLSLHRLQASESVSKVVILLTDGQNQGGELAPASVAAAVAQQGIRIYTIGIGGSSTSTTAAGSTTGALDVETLQAVADVTNGQFFLSTDPQSLEAIFREISSLERTPIQERSDRSVVEYYPQFVLWAILCFAFASASTFFGVANLLEE